MEALSTKPRASFLSSFLRSRRIRATLFLVTILFGLYIILLSTSQNVSLTRGGGVAMNGEGEPMDPVPDVSSLTDEARLHQRLQAMIDTNRIMVFSKTYCPYSAGAKKLLKSYTNDFKVLEVDLEEDGDNIKKVLTRITNGHSTYPSIFFNGESIGGKDKLQAMEDRAELKSRLESLGVSMVQ